MRDKGRAKFTSASVTVTPAFAAGLSVASGHVSERVRSSVRGADVVLK